MALNKTIKRELEVAFSKHAQPMWMRIAKYLVLGSVVYFFWSSKLLWVILLVVFALGFSVHFWYRYKTGGWTKSYGGWDYEKNKPMDR